MKKETDNGSTGKREGLELEDNIDLKEQAITYHKKGRRE